MTPILAALYSLLNLAYEIMIFQITFALLKLSVVLFISTIVLVRASLDYTTLRLAL